MVPKTPGTGRPDKITFHGPLLATGVSGELALDLWLGFLGAGGDRDAVRVLVGSPFPRLLGPEFLGRFITKVQDWVFGLNP